MNTLSPNQEAKLKRAEAERFEIEKRMIEETSPIIEAYLRLMQEAALRALDSSGSLTAAATSEEEEIDEEVLLLMAAARERMNARERGEKVTQEESEVAWLAVLSAVVLVRGEALNATLGNALNVSDLPISTYNVIKKLEESLGLRGIGIDAMRQEIITLLQLPRPALQIIQREAAGALAPPTLQDSLAKVFEAKVIEIARYASTQLAAEGQLQAMRLQGILRKQWASVWLDDRVRPSHMAAHGQVQEVEATFYVGSSRLMYPGDPMGAPEEIINCRCVLIPVE